MANFAAHVCCSPREQLAKRAPVEFAQVNLYLAVCLILVTGAGCGRTSRLTVAPVHGSVTYKGQGVPGATVIFFPVDETAEVVKKIRPFAYADDQGKFSLRTYAVSDGAPPGNYRVSILAASSNVAATNSHDAPHGEAVTAKPAVSIPPEITKKYGNVETSGLQVTVQSGENNLAPFML